MAPPVNTAWRTDDQLTQRLKSYRLAARLRALFPLPAL
jgi:hypothetical protein